MSRWRIGKIICVHQSRILGSWIDLWQLLCFIRSLFDRSWRDFRLNQRTFASDHRFTWLICCGWSYESATTVCSLIPLFRIQTVLHLDIGVSFIIQFLMPNLIKCACHTLCLLTCESLHELIIVLALFLGLNMGYWSLLFYRLGSDFISFQMSRVPCLSTLESKRIFPVSIRQILGKLSVALLFCEGLERVMLHLAWLHLAIGIGEVSNTAPCLALFFILNFIS